MNKELKITLKVDTKTGEITSVRNSFDKLDKKVDKTNRTLEEGHKKLLMFVSVSAAVYGLAKAFGFVVRSGLDYNKSMDASTAKLTAKLTAMISASKGYETVAGRQVTAMQRQKLIGHEVAVMMEILKTTNAETAMGMSDLVDIYSLAKPGMDKYKWAVKDQIEIVKLASNTASNFGMNAQELSTGIDDLAAGTWIASSGFGKMMKALGVSKKEYKDAADKVAYLKDKMKETGAAQDTWAVAVSNFQVAWDNMAGQITQPIFDGIKEALKHITIQMNDQAPSSIQIFSDALVDMVNSGISAIGTLIGWVSKLVSVFRIAIAGYKKLAGAARVYWNGTKAENQAKINELKRIQKEGAYGTFSNQTYNVVRQKILQLKKDMAASDKGASLWMNADKDLEDIAAFDSKMQNIASTVKKIQIKHSAVKPIEESIAPANQLAYKLNALSSATNKKNKADKKAKTGADAHTKALKAQEKAYKEAKKEALEYAKGSHDAYKEYLQLTGKQEEYDLLTLGDKLSELGKYLSDAQLADIYEHEMSKMKEESISLGETLREALDIKNGGFLDGLLSAFEDMGDSIVNNITDALRAGESVNKSLAQADLGVQLADGLKNAPNIYAQAAGYALDFIGALFSSTEGKEEYEANKGVREAEFNSIKDALSNSLSNVMNPQLDATNKMVKSLTNLEDMFNVIAIGLSATAGFDYNGSQFRPTEKYGTLGFSSKSTQLLGTGIEVAVQDLGDAMDDFAAQGYQDIVTRKSSWWGLKKSTKYSRTYTDLPVELQEEFASAISSGYETILTAGTALGLDADNLEEALKNSTLDIGTLDFKGMPSKEISDLLSGAFGDALGEVGQSVIPQVEDFQKAGEGYLETLVRVSSGVEQGSYAVEQLGINVIDFTDITRKGGDVTTEIIRQSITAYEDVESGIGSIVNRLDASAEELLTMYDKLKDVQFVLRDITSSLVQVTQDMLNGAGGIDPLQSALSSYAANYLTESEQITLKTGTMIAEFGRLGVTIPQSVEAYNDLLNSIDLNTASGQELYGSLIILNDGLTDVLTPMNDFKNQLVDVFVTLKEQVQNFIDGWAGGAQTDEASYKFYATRYNDLQAEMNGYFTNGVLNDGTNIDKLKETYGSLQTIANSLRGSAESLDTQSSTGVVDAVLSDMNEYLGVFTEHEEAMKVIITGDEMGLAENETLKGLQGVIENFNALMLNSMGVPQGLTLDMLRGLTEGERTKAIGGLRQTGGLEDFYKTNVKSLDDLVQVSSGLNASDASLVNSSSLSGVSTNNLIKSLGIHNGTIDNLDSLKGLKAMMPNIQNQGLKNSYNGVIGYIKRRSDADFASKSLAYQKDQTIKAKIDSLSKAYSIIKANKYYTTRAGYVRIKDSKGDAFFKNLNGLLTQGGLRSFKDKGAYHQLSYSNKNNGGVGTLSYVQKKQNEWKSKYKNMPIPAYNDYDGVLPKKAFADGGIVSRPTVGLIGEAGYPEAVIPMRNGKNIPVSIDQTQLLEESKKQTQLMITMATEMRALKKEIYEMKEEGLAVDVMPAPKVVDGVAV